MNPTTTPDLQRAQWRQFGAITAVALALYLGLRWLPTGTNLSHMDFRVDPRSGNAIEFCDPANPQFIPVVAALSPVSMAVTLAPAPGGTGVVRTAKVMLKTTTGKPVVPADLLVTHTRRLHVLIVDPTLRDYQHVHPVPTQVPGEWQFEFTPRAGGLYRFFGDFTPAATGRGLYASADATIEAPAGSSWTGATAGEPGETWEQDGFRFELRTAQRPAKTGQQLDLKFVATRADGGPVPLEPVMGAYAHLVAFDAARTGFAHLHPAEDELAKVPDARRAELNFKLTIPQAGRYTIWAQMNLGGTERFVPFALTVE
jgi:hypothetical protein